MRNIPLQNRAAATVDFILEATARIIDQAGNASLTTNHIARRAGISVGTLYRYFSNKQSILDALVEREMRRSADQMLAFLEDSAHLSSQEIIDEVASAPARAFAGRTRIRQFLVRELSGNEQLKAALHATRLEVLTALEERLVSAEPHRFRSLSDEEKHAFLGAWVGRINAVVTHAPTHYSTAEFKDGFVKLIHHHLGR